MPGLETPEVIANESVVAESELKEKKKKKKDKSEKKEKSPEKKKEKKRKHESDDETKSKKKKKKKDTEVTEEASSPEKQVQVDDTIILQDDASIYEKKDVPKEETAIPEHLRLTSHNLSQATMDALKARGISQLFPIQAATLKPVLEGKDMLAKARTGTGKTLAFSLPMIERLRKEKANDPGSFKARGRAPRILIMAPTRELALQVNREIESISLDEFKCLCVYGGTPYDGQNSALRSGVDIVVGTPGRLIDHIERRNLRLDKLLFICMDEADQMLDIGFADSMEKILESTKEQKENSSSAIHQTLLFSATLPAWIKDAVQKFMRPDKATVDLIGNSKDKTSDLVTHYAVASRWQNRADILGDIVAVYGRGGSGRTMIFVETKGEANELGLNEKLVAMGTQVLHGDISQKQREIAMQGFRDGRYSCLIATNVCARGVDIPEVDLVINCEPPNDVESYIHRSGRTGRAGKSGVCVTFYKPSQEYSLQNISRRAGVEFIKIGAPHAKDIVAAQANESLDRVKNDVDPQVFAYFDKSAKELLEHYEGDALKALSAAFAVICNTTKPLPSRSLLSANQGYMTLLFKVPSPIRNVGYIRSIMQRNHPDVTYDDTVTWRMTADSLGVIVDISDKKVQVIESETESELPRITLGGVEWNQTRGITLEVCKELPELQERPGFGDAQSGGHGRGGYSNGRSSGRGGFSSGNRGGYQRNGPSSRGSFRGNSGGRFQRR